MPRHWRVAEVFGPTIQGEGRQAGLPAYFIRFGGCDLRCVWCDTPHAVLPVLISQLPKMSAEEILGQLQSLPYGPDWVVITGGNPATLKLDEVVTLLHDNEYKIMVETQGTVFNEWLLLADEICISPKPPSSENPVTFEQLNHFLAEGRGYINVKKSYLKIPIFSMEDYEYAKDLHKRLKLYEMFLSVGNSDPSLPTVGNPTPQVGGDKLGLRHQISERLRYLATKVANDPFMSDVKVLPQLHVLAWGNDRGH